MTGDYERFNYWENEIKKPLTNEEKKSIYNNEIDKAVDSVKSGQFISHDDVIKELDKL